MIIPIKGESKLGISNFFGNLKKSIKEGNSVMRENIALKSQYNQMIKDLEENIKNAKTEEERERFVKHRQEIIDEGKRIHSEEQN